MDTIEVPEVRQTSSSTDIVDFADMVLTSLFGHLPAMLFAEGDGHRQDQPVVLFIRPLGADTAQHDVPIATLDSCSHFRAMLARFGHHYMSDQLYGGHTRCILSQRGQKFGCRIFMSNEGASGFWIRVYAHAAS